ncbi:MAG TPA: 2-C-methyl-D-erythritol 4-phosphate cytidylyltransferase [Thermoanaerobaculia bacterium]|nr:2-C-methyl-D-erythritol 4-phosphate cytidylyltransferase [Thermoanaerobaculia bacterium]
MSCIVIIPAAGSGSRFGSSTPKQFVPLRGRPLIAHTLERVLSVPEVERIIVAVAEEYEPVMRELVEEQMLERVRIVIGGSSRQESVLKAIRAIEHEEQKIVAIHDAVRPFFRASTFVSLIDTARKEGAAIPVRPLHETIHRVENGLIMETLDRSELVAAQTPQCFRVGLVYPLLERAWHESLSGTDEAAIITSYGVSVRVIEGDPENLKITTPADLALAELKFDEWTQR